MIRLSVNMHRRYPGHEVKAIISFTDLGVKSKEFKDNLKNLRLKLEQIIPASLRVKYMEHQEGLILVAKMDKLNEAQSINNKLNDYIRTAAMSLNFKIMG